MNYEERFFKLLFRIDLTCEITLGKFPTPNLGIYVLSPLLLQG